MRTTPLLTLMTRITISFILTLLMAPAFANTTHTQMINQLSPSEREWLSQNPIIRLGIDRAFPPFGSITEDNEYIGFTADYMALIEERLGIKFEVFQNASWSETIQLAKNGKLDMIAGLVNTNERQGYLEFTPTYIKTPTIIFNDGLKNGFIGEIKQLDGKKVAVEDGSFVSEMLSKEHPEIIQIRTQNTEQALGIVAASRADAYIGNAATGSYLIKKMGLNSLFYAGATPYSSNHSIGVVKPNTLLASIMNKALKSIDSKTHDAIVDKWFGMQVYPHIRLSTAIWASLIALGAMVLSAIWIRTLYQTRKALKLSENKVRQQANIDSLTGLINRRNMHDILRHESSKPHANHSSFALLFLDLDEFKEVNDTLGHSIGDELLKRVAQRLTHCVRANDTVARLGGDEFTIILNKIHHKETIERVAQKVCDSLSQEFMIEGQSINVSTSIGITLFPQDAKTADDLLSNADQAMYACKKKGSNGYCFFTETMRQALRLRNETLRDLKVAVTEQQLELHYQPILDLNTCKIVKAEALIRWNHPERGMISPDLFITLAEESGQIIDIGEWIFKEATKQVAEWREKYFPTFQVSINTSPVQYRDRGINIESWCIYLRELGISGQALIVEITEGLLMESSMGVKQKLWSLRDAGIEVAIDDFGTGYSSLSYLKKFDIDYLKIDQSFVSNLTEGSDDIALCEAISVMAHKLGCCVVAEGIETNEQSELLKKAGCDFGQGYLFAKPMPAVQLSELLSQSQDKSEGNRQIDLFMENKKAASLDAAF